MNNIKCLSSDCKYNAQERCTIPNVEIDEEGMCATQLLKSFPHPSYGVFDGKSIKDVFTKER